jgi:flagellar motor protein MotB
VTVTEPVAQPQPEEKATPEPAKKEKERPVDPRHNEEAWAKNRRTEFVIKIQPSFSDAY